MGFFTLHAFKGSVNLISSDPAHCIYRLFSRNRPIFKEAIEQAVQYIYRLFKEARSSCTVHIRLFKEARSSCTVHIQTIQDRTGQQAVQYIYRLFKAERDNKLYSTYTDYSRKLD